MIKYIFWMSHLGCFCGKMNMWLTVWGKLVSVKMISQGWSEVSLPLTLPPNCQFFINFYDWDGFISIILDIFQGGPTCPSLVQFSSLTAVFRLVQNRLIRNCIWHFHLQPCLDGHISANLIIVLLVIVWAAFLRKVPASTSVYSFLIHSTFVLVCL